MKSLENSNMKLFCAVLVGSFILAGCGKGKEPAVVAVTPQQSATPADALTVTLPESMAERVKVGKPEVREIAQTLRVPGRIEVDERRLSQVGSSIAGRVTEVFVNVGDAVSPGKALAMMSSPELTNAQLSFLRASSTATLADKTFERARLLFAADVIGKAELQRREAEQKVAQAEFHAAQDQLRLLGMGLEDVARLRIDGDIKSAVPITAQRAGVVIERKVTQGQVVQPADQLFTVADLSAVWAVGGVPERAARSVAVNQLVDVEVVAVGKVIPGRIVFVSDTISPDARTVTVRTEVKNPDRTLKPAMLATLEISRAAEEKLTVPSTAVVRHRDKDHVFMAKSGNKFTLVPVDLDVEIDGVRPVLKGLSVEDTIVLDGAFHLNNERKRAGQE
jgi:cobalt-zinc-cadmium efflux system membrane fusion protein